MPSNEAVQRAIRLLQAELDHMAGAIGAILDDKCACGCTTPIDLGQTYAPGHESHGPVRQGATLYSVCVMCSEDIKSTMAGTAWRHLGPGGVHTHAARPNPNVEVIKAQ